MAINRAVLAAFKVASRLSPGIKHTYKVQRIAEDVSAAAGFPDPRCRIQQASCMSPDGYEIPLLVFTPREVEFSLHGGLKVGEPCEGCLGTILFFHGGGWANGDVDFYSDACARTAIELNRRLVSVDYRRAPEHRFPQAPEDCYEVARQLFAGELRLPGATDGQAPAIDPDDIVLFGDSAGGNLAAVVSLMARERGDFSPRTQMLLYPATYNDHTPQSRFDSVRTNGQDYLLTSRDVEGYMDLYQSSPADRENPHFAPLLASDLSGQPRTLVITAEYCPLRDEGEEYARRLAQAGNDVACYRMLDAIHGYLLYPSVFNIVKNTYRVMRHFLDGEELEGAGTAQAAGEEAAWLEIPGIA